MNHINGFGLYRFYIRSVFLKTKKSISRSPHIKLFPTVWPYSCYLLSPIDINFHRPLDYSTLSRSSMNNNTRHAMLASRSSSPSDEWILDSGATHHLTSTSHNLQNSRPYLACENGIVGNGKQLPISAVGSKTFCSNSTSFHLPTVYLVPQLTTNLISVAQFCKDTSSYIEFHPSHFFVKDQCVRSVTRIKEKK